MTREPVLPAVRAAVFTAVCLGLSVAAHRAMSATAIPPWAMLLGGVGVYAAARAGSRRERGLVGIAALMGALQIALHLLFAIAQNTSVPAASMTMPMPSGTSMSMPMPMSMPSGTSMPGMTTAQPDAGMHMGAGMLLAHALAALACAWWLRRGEAALHALARSVAHWVVEHVAVRAHVVPIAPPRRPLSHVIPTLPALRARWLLTSVVLRGPPICPSFT